MIQFGSLNIKAEHKKKKHSRKLNWPKDFLNLIVIKDTALLNILKLQGQQVKFLQAPAKSYLLEGVPLLSSRCSSVLWTSILHDFLWHFLLLTRRCQAMTAMLLKAAEWEWEIFPDGVERCASWTWGERVDKDKTHPWSMQVTVWDEPSTEWKLLPVNWFRAFFKIKKRDRNMNYARAHCYSIQNLQKLEIFSL